MALDTSILEGIGLTKAQIQVYVALLELGQTTTGPLIRKSGLQNSVVYNALNQLLEHGLATFVSKGKRKYFSAADPHTLVQFIDDKKEKIEALLPELLVKQTAVQQPEARVFIGWKGIFAAFSSILEILPKGSDYAAFAAGFEEQLNEGAKQFFREFQKKRQRMQYKVRLIANEESRKAAEQYGYYNAFGKPEYRFVPGYAPVGIIIFGDYVLHSAFGKEPIAVMIRSKLIAGSIKNAFEGMWEAGKP